MDTTVKQLVLVLWRHELELPQNLVRMGMGGE